MFDTGAGTVVLRRLENAVRDNNNYAVILGSAVNNDAADRAGFTAPSISGQRALMEAAFADALAIVEELPKAPTGGSTRPWQLFPLSARTDAALDAATENLAKTFAEALGGWAAFMGAPGAHLANV
ncbi:hypothetical protein ACPEIC_46740 [Stenotrophomonas sp. NPDC087984]